MKLIDKDRAIAEIEKEIKQVYAGREYVGIPSNEENMVRGLQKSEDLINSLEVKEVDINKEIEKELYSQRWKGEYINTEKFRESAKHFFELALSLKNNGLYEQQISKGSERVKVIDNMVFNETEVDLGKLLSDLDKDIKEFVGTEEFERESITAGHYWVIAKHAFLLGLKEQKGK